MILSALRKVDRELNTVRPESGAERRATAEKLVVCAAKMMLSSDQRLREKYDSDSIMAADAVRIFRNQSPNSGR